jgi:hypothetical protein
MSEPAPRIDFAAVNAAAVSALPALLRRWLPDGQWQGNEYVARNPRRADHRPGSFKINRNGRWADFASGDRGGDVVSLAAYLAGLGQVEAARELARALGIATP